MLAASPIIGVAHWPTWPEAQRWVLGYYPPISVKYVCLHVVKLVLRVLIGIGKGFFLFCESVAIFFWIFCMLTF